MLSPNAPRCKGKSRQHGGPCGNPPIPFGDYCRFHGGNTKAHREKARKRMLEYAQWSTDPWYIKQRRIRQWQDAQDNYEMRRAKKTGPEWVEGLKRERAALKAQRQREIEENRRARAERHREQAEEWRRSQGRTPVAPPPPAEEPTGGFDPWAGQMDWDL